MCRVTKWWKWLHFVILYFVHCVSKINVIFFSLTLCDINWFLIKFGIRILRKHAFKKKNCPPCLKTVTTLFCVIQKCFFSGLHQDDNVRNVKATAETVSRARSLFHFFTRKGQLLLPITTQSDLVYACVGKHNVSASCLLCTQPKFSYSVKVPLAISMIIIVC